MVVYDIDDLLDEVATDALQQNLNRGHFRRQLRYYLSSSNPLISRFHLSHKIKDLREKLVNVVAKKNDFGLTDRLVETRVVRDVFDECSHVYAPDIIGRDEAKKDIITRLFSVNNNVSLSVLPVIGMGGIGKTALAKLVYNDVDVAHHFDLKLWACVSDKFEINKVLMDLLKGATSSKGGSDVVGENGPKKQLGILIKDLQDLLSGKKYIIVLDDVWVEDFNEWRNLTNILENGIAGSVVLITTRIAKVASMTETMKSYDLDSLPDMVCRSIFKQLAFKDDGEEQMYPKLVDIGRCIVEKCSGVPLVVRSLGSLLRSERDEQEWLRINNLDSFAKLDEIYVKVMQLLKLSYDKLPSHLKPCFAFLCLYRRDMNLHAINASVLWNALGLLLPEDGKQDVIGCGSKYLLEMISRSLLQEVEFICGFSDCKMHDLLHNLAVDIMGEELAIVTWKELKVSENVVHVFWGYETPNYLKYKEFPKELLKARKVRTFTLGYEINHISRSYIDGIISNFPCLRILDLGGSWFEELPSSIGNLKHLRYLDLSDNCIIRSLPNAICKLVNLETFGINGCHQLQELNRDVHLLQNLKMLFLTTCQMSLIDSAINELSSLEFLLITSCERLVTLWDNHNENLGCLTNLRFLFINDCPKLTSIPNNINSIVGLDTLMIRDCEEMDLERGEVTKGLDNMRILLLSGLPKLRCLPQGIQHAATSLQSLTLISCQALVVLPDWLQSFVSLESIQICDCPNLLGLPNGFCHLKSLKILEIMMCPHLSEKCDVPSGENYNLIRHVPRFNLDGVWFTPFQTL